MNPLTEFEPLDGSLAASPGFRIGASEMCPNALHRRGARSTETPGVYPSTPERAQSRLD